MPSESHLIATWQAVASMAMCEEATFVFAVKEVQRMMMPFVAARKAPVGTVLVIEVGLTDVRRENGKRREVNDFLFSKFRLESAQKKLDRIEEQKVMRLRERRDRAEKVIPTSLASDYTAEIMINT